MCKLNPPLPEDIILVFKLLLKIVFYKVRTADRGCRFIVFRVLGASVILEYPYKSAIYASLM